MKTNRFAVIILAVALVCSAQSHAANLASDSAADVAYDDGWQPGDNGGSGWGGGWSLFSGVGSAFIGSSTTNGIGDPGSDGDIDTQGRSWGLFTGNPSQNAHSVASAVRPFNGALSLGQQFVIDVDPGPSGGFGSGYSGFSLRDDQTNERFRLTFSFGLVFIQDVNTGISSTDQGFHVVFTLTGTDSYNVTLYSVGTDGPSGLPVSFSGSLFVPNGTGIVDVKLFAVDTGPNPVNWQFFNSMAIIPEPTTFALVAIGVLAALSFRRCKNSC
jgi:hypothetical protein